MAARYPELAKLLEQKSLRRGHFVLTSGATSTYYIDGKMTCMDPLGATLIARAILNEIKDLPVDAVGGMDMGATPIVGAVATQSYEAGRPLPVFVVRKEAKQHGTKKPIEGPLPEKARVVLVDDVVTTGGSLIKAIDVAEAAGCKVLLAITVLDRNAGAAEAIAARGIPYQPLATLADIGIFDGPAAVAAK
ncbi:MAG: orotate phosphoribosyltransferase [Planctomycetota bacterium]|nr:orotate phosphoribosyltransferase [Planctomycetota bacterium]